MSKLQFSRICFAVLAVTILFTVFFGAHDKPAIFIESLGAFGTVATLYVAFRFFNTYNAPADIQKKRFELVDKALATFITKRFLLITDTEQTFFPYLTKNSLDYCIGSLEADKLGTLPILMSYDALEYFVEFQSQLEHHYFPHKLKRVILFNLPQGSKILPDKDTQGKIRLAFSFDTQEYGYPIMTNDATSANEFLGAMNVIRMAMIDYLNDNVSREHQIIDQNI